MNVSDTPMASAKGSVPQRLLRALWLPGTGLMRQLRFRYKMAVVVLALSIPAAFLAWQTIGALHNSHKVLSSAGEGMRVYKAVLAAESSLVSIHRMSVLKAAGMSNFDAPLEQEVKRGLVRLEELDQAVTGSKSMERLLQWPTLRSQMKLALTQTDKGTANDNAFRTATARVHEFKRQVMEHSRITELQGPGSDMMTGMSLHLLDKLSGDTNDFAILGSTILAKGESSTDIDRGRALGLAMAIRSDFNVLAERLNTLSARSVKSPGSWEKTTELAQALLDTSGSRWFASAKANDSTLAFFDAASLLVGRFHATEHDIISRLEEIVAAGKVELERKAVFLGLFWLAGGLCVLYIVFSYLMAITGGSRHLLKAMNATAAGDFSHAIRTSGRDEIAQMCQVFDKMNDRLSNLTSDIRSRAARVDQSGQQVSEGNHRLSERTEEQSGRVVSALEAVGQITAAAAQNAQATCELDELTGHLFEKAEVGNVAMAETLTAMDELQGASSRVADMVAVIDDVAFHTGMLALNASVEAARAGEAGKGFSVVAAEIRQLALRCGESADVIRGLTQDSRAKVEASADKLQHVTVALDQLVNGVREVSNKLRGIAAANLQQSSSLEELEHNFESLNLIAKDNASWAERSMAASNILLAQGTALTHSVAGMRLRHGSADEARTLVERALEHAKARGRDQALRDFNSDAENWVDRDLFVFSIDLSGIIVANAMTPTRVGLSVNELEGLRGTHHAQRLWDCVEKNGTGWVPYRIAHPLTGELRRKESFVAAIDSNTLVACGCYAKESEAHDENQTPAHRAPQLEMAPS